MTLSAAFSVNSSTADQAHETTYGATVNLALTSLEAHTISWSIAGTSHADVVAPTITAAGTPTGATASFTMVSDPGDLEGRAVLVKCVVRDSAGTQAVAYEVVGVPNANGVVPLVVDEEYARSATHGWGPTINKCLAAPTVIPEVASDTTATSAGGTAAYSFPLPTSGKKYLIKFVIEAKERVDLINYTHIAYVLAWHDGSAAQKIGTESVVINAAHNSSGASATVQFSVAYTESTTNVVATLTNSTDNTADVNVYATIEQAWSASP